MNELDQAAQGAVYSLYALAVSNLALCTVYCLHSLAVCLILCYAPHTVCITLLCV